VVVVTIWSPQKLVGRLTTPDGKYKTRDWKEKGRSKGPKDIQGMGVGYGCMPYALGPWLATRDAGYDWCHFDGPYWLRKKGEAVRYSWNQYQWTYDYGPDLSNEGDLEAAGCVFREWQIPGDIVYVAPNNATVHREIIGVERSKWVDDTIAKLKKHTDRKIIVREKPGNLTGAGRTTAEKGLDTVCRRAWAIVTPASTIGVEAICRGVPVFYTHPNCVVKPMASNDLSKIESPVIPDEDERVRWAHNLAARQFTVKQLANGEAWTIMQADLDAQRRAHAEDRLNIQPDPLGALRSREH
jgi:hypothetical protein